MCLVRIFILLQLTKEPVAGRAVRAVNLRVAVHARAANQTVAARRELRAVVDRGWVPRRDVAPLAEHRRFGDEHAVVVRAVRVVAGRAVLGDRRVLPQERPALLGVAARAFFVDPSCRPSASGRWSTRAGCGTTCSPSSLHGPACGPTSDLQRLDLVAGLARVDDRPRSSAALSRTSGCARCGTSCTTGCAHRACCPATRRARPWRGTSDRSR